ncbi:hypothetical protein [Staphylococcus haemolyticus]|nr:hypothetical protein [Staphylococcus haemolyticus]
METSFTTTNYIMLIMCINYYVLMKPEYEANTQVLVNQKEKIQN